MPSHNCFEAMQKCDLLYLINGELELNSNGDPNAQQGEFVLLAESSKDGALNIFLETAEYGFDLKAYEPTRIKISFKNQANNKIAYKYNFRAFDSSGPAQSNNGSNSSLNSGEGYFLTDFSENASYGLISCVDVTKEKKANIFKHLGERTATFFLGDMIYGDSALYCKPGDSYTKVFDNYDLSLSEGEIHERYKMLYRLTYHKYQQYMRIGMNIVMPDDHEFYNGFGIVGDDKDPNRIKCAKAAYGAFKLYELSLRIDNGGGEYIFPSSWGIFCTSP